MHNPQTELSQNVGFAFPRFSARAAGGINTAFGGTWYTGRRLGANPQQTYQIC